MTPAELNALRDKVAEIKDLPKNDLCSEIYVSSFELGLLGIGEELIFSLDVGIEIGKALGRIEIYDKIKELCEYKANNGITSLSAPTFIALAEHCAGWAKAEREKLENLKNG
jgi:hypothetical protein